MFIVHEFFFLFVTGYVKMKVKVYTIVDKNFFLKLDNSFNILLKLKQNGIKTH